MTAVISRHSVTAQLNNGENVKGISGSFTVDEGWSPYVQATLVCKTPASLVGVDPRGAARVLLRVGQTFGDSPKVSALTALFAGPAKRVSGVTAAWVGKSIAQITAMFFIPFNGFGIRASTRRFANLGLRRRSIDRLADTVTLTLASDEALLQDYALVGGATFTPQIVSVEYPFVDLRSTVMSVLELIGTMLHTSGPIFTANIDPETSKWSPGQSAWDYLAPLVQKAGGRLWCDEQRRWFLTQANLTTPGLVPLSYANTAVDIRDEINRDGDWCDAVVVIYKWSVPLNGGGVQQFVQYDTAAISSPTRVRTFTYEDTIFPGTGAAQQILTRALSLGRSLEVSALSDYTLSPGQATTVTTLPGDVTAVVVTAVTFNWPANEMSIKTRT